MCKKTVLIKAVLLMIFIQFTINSLTAQGSWQSEIVYFDEHGKLVYISDSEDNRIPDFSYAGYKNSEEPIPDIQVVKTISPISGDNTAHIQNAINEMGALPLDENGFRGTLLLTAGEYEIQGTLSLNISGVVVRGEGDGADTSSNTILYAVGNTPSQRNVLTAGGGINTQWSDQVPNTIQDIVSEKVLVGSREFNIDDASPFTAGDNIIIYHPCTEGWLEAIDSGGTHSGESGSDPFPLDQPWAPGSKPLLFNRNIEEINGTAVTVDAPVFNHLDRSLSQSYIYKYSRNGIKTNIGIENLRIDIETLGGEDEDHAWNAVDMLQIEDAWIRDCTMLHFGLSGVRTWTATRITIERCNALDPVSTLEGHRRYNFNVSYASQLVLFKECHASNGRHHYISNGVSLTSGCVFLNCTSSGAWTSSEGHRYWTTGLLFDNHTELDGPRIWYDTCLIGLYNRGNWGDSHGWSSAHSVAWNCDVADGSIGIQKPPTAQNYAIGCIGVVSGGLPTCWFNEPAGYIEGTNQTGLEPPSLFNAQLEERINDPSNINRLDAGIHGYWLFQNYPNPFNPKTVISYQLPVISNVELSIFNLLGQRVAAPVSEKQPAGTYKVVWDGSGFASGIYFCRIKTNNGFTQTTKMLLKK